MAFEPFKNAGPLAPPKSSVSFGAGSQSQPQSRKSPLTTPLPQSQSRKSPSPPRPTQSQFQHSRRSPPPHPSPTSLSPPRSRPKSRSPPPPTSPPRPSRTHEESAAQKTKPNMPRSRSPTPIPPADEAQREMEAKARRLARFKSELNNPIRPSSPPFDKQQQQQQQQPVPTPKKDVDEAMDYEDAEPILGTCSDMCPESERGERERKADLDKYERFHGDRNLTDKSIAVKKYNRTAEREASLIRPLPVLQMTMDHLLDLIDRSYDDDFLNIYNFLWDRMRAIRMDLRIQHIFNKDAVTMHEQMIRFHIIAMHELCEYTKGEGFSEGFDAHLNIEQMNKASVELFQMYDDHRRHGSVVPTEQEFRGYYALLKLDKHPGYKVEPAELSLDLAKMTSEMRNTNEVLFAREVARASRSCNYIAFFRLARKATYLQACLMHAHFAKLRTQALASLHSGLQKNQGIPVSQVVKWLAMEGEDIEGLLEYHGFSLKQFEDLYMVKEGPFLKSDVHFPTRCSQLVHQKRSPKVVSDVISSGQVPIMDGNSHSAKTLDVEVDKLSNRAKDSDGPVLTSAVVPPEEEMPDYEEDGLLNDDDKNKDWEMQEAFGSDQIENIEEVDKLETTLPIANSGGEPAILRSGAAKHTMHWSLQEKQVNKKRRNVPELDVEVKRRLLPLNEHSKNVVERETARPLDCDISEMRETEIDWSVVEANRQVEKAKLAVCDAEADNIKSKLLLRRWKHQVSKIAESRRMRRSKANAALNSLFVGPPVRTNRGITCRDELVGDILSCSLSTVELNIDQIVKERRNRHIRMWLKLDVSELVAPILSQKNPHAKCLCWKLILYSPSDDKSCTHSSHIVGQWLRAKLLRNNERERKELSVSMSEVVITQHNSSHGLFCLSIMREIAFNAEGLGNEQAGLGASGLLFLLIDNVQWELEQMRLQFLVRSVKPGSCLPLLILSSGNVEESAIENELELNKLDRMRISCWSVIHIAENEHNSDAKGFLNDDCLRKGLLWLADHAPPQPNVYPSDVRDLVLESLEPYLNILLNAKPSEVTPNYCIHAFNQALSETESDIIVAAKNSLPGWPAAEIKELDLRTEGGFLDACLPKPGWNMASNIEAIVHALRLCRLPEFSFKLDSAFCGVHSQELFSSNLHPANNKLDEIHEQKISLQKCLYQYLCQISFGKKGDLMTLKEADLMVQKHITYECIDMKYIIVPQWASIFRRIYNSRLMLLASEPPPIVYVSHPRKVGLLIDELKQHLLSPARQIFMSSGYANQVVPSLNKMIGSNCRVISRDLRLEPNVQPRKNQFKQHAEDGNPEYMVKNCCTEGAKNSYGRNNFEPEEVPLTDISVPAEHIAKEVKFQIPDMDEVQHTVEFGQTDGELQLNQVVTDFCEKVNEQKRRISLLIEGANTTECTAISNPTARPCLADKDDSACEEIGRSQSCASVNSAYKAIDCRTAISSPTWPIANAMDNLNELLQRCSAVQSSIDKKLAACFGKK